MTTDPEVRRAYVAGLRALARFLASHPEAPVPDYGTTIGLPVVGETDEDERREVDVFAAAMGAVVTADRDGHYTVSRAFGPIRYGATAITAERMAAHDAETSYRGCVSPEARAA
jgi:hypothetical protein